MEKEKNYKNQFSLFLHQEYVNKMYESDQLQQEFICLIRD